MNTLIALGLAMSLISALLLSPTWVQLIGAAALVNTLQRVPVEDFGAISLILLVPALLMLAAEVLGIRVKETQIAKHFAYGLSVCGLAGVVMGLLIR